MATRVSAKVSVGVIDMDMTLRPAAKTQKSRTIHKIVVTTLPPNCIETKEINKPMMNLGVLVFMATLSAACAFQTTGTSSTQFHVAHGPATKSVRSSVIASTRTRTRTKLHNDLSNMATSRFPTSPEDQVRQAAISIKEASKDGKKRHSVRLLLPIIGATELDDWPGGARQMMEAAAPLVKDVMTLQIEDLNDNDSDSGNSEKVGFNIAESVIDEADGVRALFGQASSPEDDSCSILLPSADNVSKLQELDQQVGAQRNMLLVNSQWKRKTDFGMAFFGGNRDEKINFVEGFEPTFHCSNIMVEGDIVRILRTYPGPWRVYLRVANADDEMDIDWVEIGTKDLIFNKTPEWEKAAKAGDQDGGKLFDYGIPLYGEVTQMIVSREGYIPKSLSERAAAAFTFIKDTL